MNYVTDISRKFIYTLSSSTMNWWKICYHFFRVIDIMRNNVISKKFKAKFKLDYLEICKYAQICFFTLFYNSTKYKYRFYKIDTNLRFVPYVYLSMLRCIKID